MKTHVATQQEIQKSHKFYLVDAKGKTLGRLATQVARLLTGKHKPIYTPFLDTGDHVIVVNADQIVLTGNKWNQKEMIHHTLYPGGIKREEYKVLIKDKPEKIVHQAVWGMIPKNRLGRKMIKKLRVYRGPDHPHQSCKPEPYEVK